MGQNNGMTKSFIVGLLAGGAIGAVVALLFAPKSGKELRAELKEKADDLIGEAESYVESARAKASQIVTDARRRSDELVADAKSKADSLMHDADKIMSGVRQKAGTAVDDGIKIKNAVKAGVDAFKEERGRS